MHIVNLTNLYRKFFKMFKNSYKLVYILGVFLSIWRTFSENSVSWICDKITWWRDKEFNLCFIPSWPLNGVVSGMGNQWATSLVHTLSWKFLTAWFCHRLCGWKIDKQGYGTDLKRNIFVRAKNSLVLPFTLL